MIIPAPLTLNVMLTVSRMSSGGNTGDGKYLYAFNPSLLIVTQSPVTVTFQLSPDTSKDFVIEDYVSTDSRFQLDPGKVSDGRRTLAIVNQNTQRCLIFLTLLVRDVSNNFLINCDPQMTNVPVGG